MIKLVLQWLREYRHPHYTMSLLWDNGGKRPRDETERHMG